MKLLSPVLYLVASALAGIVCVSAMVYLANISWMPQLFFFAMPLLFVGAVLVPCGWALLWLERTRRSTLSDHLRRCVFLYANLMLLGASWVTFFYDDGVAPALAEFGFFFYTALAILIDALVLLCWRRRFDYSAEAVPA